MILEEAYVQLWTIEAIDEGDGKLATNPVASHGAVGPHRLIISYFYVLRLGQSLLSKTLLRYEILGLCPAED